MKTKRKRTLIPCLAGACLLAGSAQAATVAYFRFEEATSGVVPGSATGGDPAFNGTVLDSSGNGSHFRTWNNTTGPAYVTNVAVATVPGTGAANTAALSFDGNDDIYPSADIGLPGVDFSQVTIEAWVNFSSLAGWQTFIGRDDSGNPGQGAGPESLFYFQKAGDGTDRFRIRAYDSTGAGVSVHSSFAVEVNTWYHVAAVVDDTTLYLYVDGVLQESQPFEGGLFDPNPDTGWTIGRGQFNGNVGDFMLGMIDEVRFSDVALSPGQFLNVPEPSVSLLGLFGALGILRRRRC